MIKKYKIREIAMILGKEGTDKAGQPLGKKMVLKEDDAQNEEPRVTVWNDHPECEAAQVGDYITGYLDKKDSGTPIPGRTGNYVNRTLYATEKNPNGTDKPDTDAVSIINGRLQKLEAKVFGQAQPVPTVEYPEEDGIKAEDIPF